MSLINDALRKARQAAAEHEDRRPESAFRAPRAYPSKASRRGTGMAAVVLIAVVAAVSGAALVWWAFDRANQPETAVVAPAEIQPQQPVPDMEPPQVSQSTDQPPTAEDEPATIPDHPENSTASPSTQLPEQLGPQTSPTEVSQQIAEEPKPPSHGNRIFVLDANLGDIKLSLGYIVARGTNPFAEINGAEVVVGSEIAGFVVESIEADQVTLIDSNGPLVLKVR